MKNLLKNKKLKFNSKKGFTLIELIVAVMILLVVISASVRGVSISYRSALLGAEKNDAQSLAQRNCDIIMSAIVTNVENKTFANEYTLDGMVRFGGDGFANNGSNTYLDWVCDDTDIILENDIGYDKDQYAELKQVVGGVEDVKSQKADDVLDARTSLQPIKKYQYFTLSRKQKEIGSSTYQVYKITTYVYYSDNGFVTCEGEVSVMPAT
ncbi:MAG: prepilin-type N-terminal cleavage/methylation domain-containing protein [Acutalibacteraceae bacterium]|nr:prepilin-type N-terminal cleavage/methylation domain-containing protein [Acutalibacteraceae bacterium]